MGRQRPTVSRRLLANVVLSLLVVIFVVTSLAVDPGTEAGVVLLSLGASLASLGLLQLIWLLAGGEPMQTEVENLRDETVRLSNEITSATDTLRDLHDAGIERVYSQRGGKTLVREWNDLARDAKEIDLLGFTMYHEWLDKDELKAALVAVAGRPGGTVRILVLPPLSTDAAREPEFSVANLNYLVRRRQPGEYKGRVLRGYLESAHDSLAELQDLASATQLEVRFLSACMPYCMLVRIDSYMYVAPYLASAQGEDSFAMTVRGPSDLFKLYSQEFEAMWKAEARS